MVLREDTPNVTGCPIGTKPELVDDEPKTAVNLSCGGAIGNVYFFNTQQGVAYRFQR